MLENENQRVAVAPKVTKKGKVEVEEVYENNWDLSLIDKMSPNVAKWIVYEKMKEPRFVFISLFWLASGPNPLEGDREHYYKNDQSDEADLKQRQKLSKLVTEKYGPTNQNENVELIPEDISGGLSDSVLSLATFLSPDFHWLRVAPIGKPFQKLTFENFMNSALKLV